LKKYYNIRRELHPNSEKLQVVGDEGVSVDTVSKCHPVFNTGSPSVAHKTEREPKNHLKLVEKNSKTSFRPFDDGILTLEKASTWLANIESSNDAATILSRLASQMFNRTALFMIRGEMAWGWVGTVQGKIIENFDLFQIPLKEPSILKSIVETKKNFVGSVPFSPLNSRIMSSFGGSFQEDAALLPLTILGRVVAVIYVAEEKKRPIEYLLFKLKLFVSKTVMAMEILILKKKLLCVEVFPPPPR
jgi:hypothetical protein